MRISSLSLIAVGLFVHLLIISLLSLLKCRIKEKSKLSRLEQWVKYLSATVPAGEEIIPGDEMFTQLSRIEKVYGKDKEELLRYEAAERAEMDFVSAISSAELRGKEIGKAEGKAEGRAEERKFKLRKQLKPCLIWDCPYSKSPKLPV